MVLLELGVLQLQKTEGHPLKLKEIFEHSIRVIEKHKPDELAIEAPFFGKNVQSMLKLGRAQGVAMAAALSRSIPITEYSPKKIKQSITGNGNASKEQVAAMLQSLLQIQEMPRHLDATDGLAAAVCHYFQNGEAASTTAPAGKKNYNSWKKFLAENPGRKG
jgi:crossover junction endodeoxyribonuclease RuvC